MPNVHMCYRLVTVNHIRTVNLGRQQALQIVLLIQPSTSSGLPYSSQQPSEAPTCEKARLLQPQMSGFTVAMDNKMQQQLDQQVARFFYACNIPFAVVEQQEFNTAHQYASPRISATKPQSDWRVAA